MCVEKMFWVDWYSPVYLRNWRVSLGLSFFCKDNGFDDESVLLINNMDVGDVVKLDFNCLVVKRLF